MEGWARKFVFNHNLTLTLGWTFTADLLSHCSAIGTWKRERERERMCIQWRQHKEMLKQQPCELGMAEIMCDPILSCPRFKNLASSRLAHNQRRKTNEWRWRKRRDGEMQEENQHEERRTCSERAAPSLDEAHAGPENTG